MGLYDPGLGTLAALTALLIEAGPIAITLAVLLVGAVGLALLVRQRRRKQPSVDFVMGSMDDLSTVEEGANLNGASKRASVVRSGKSR